MKRQRIGTFLDNIIEVDGNIIMYMNAMVAMQVK